MTDDIEWHTARTLLDSLPPGAVLARRTAALLWGVDVLPPPAGPAAHPPEVLLPAPGSAGDGFTVIAGEADEAEVTCLHGVRLTTRDRTALDCGRWLPRLGALAALDGFLRGGADGRALKAKARDLGNAPNAARLRELLRLADPGAASPGESWTRLRVIDAGLSRPATQLPEPGPNGRDLRVDLGDPNLRVGVEYDGEAHHTSTRDRAHDRARRAWLASAGWTIIPVTKHDVLLEPRPFLAAYLEALLTRGWHPPPTRLCRIHTAISRAGPRPL